MKTETIFIDGMSCGHCVMALKKELSKLDIVIKDAQIGKAEVEYDPAKVSREKILEAIDEAGYKAVD